MKVANMYKEGLGLPESFARSFAWFNVAAASGDEEAKSARELMRKKMTPDQVAEGQRLSRSFFDIIQKTSR